MQPKCKFEGTLQELKRLWSKYVVLILWQLFNFGDLAVWGSLKAQRSKHRQLSVQVWVSGRMFCIGCSLWGSSPLVNTQTRTLQASCVLIVLFCPKLQSCAQHVLYLLVTQQIQIILLCSGPCSQHFCLSLCPTQGIVHKCGTMVGKSLDACGVVLDLSYYVCPWRESDCAHSSMSFHGCVNKLGLSAVASPLAPNQWKLQWFLLAKTLKQLASMLRLRKTKWYASPDMLGTHLQTILTCVVMT